MARHCSHCGCELRAGEDNHQPWCPNRKEIAPVRCAVCGGPGVDGGGCEFCPAVTPAEMPFR